MSIESQYPGELAAVATADPFPASRVPQFGAEFDELLAAVLREPAAVESVAAAETAVVVERAGRRRRARRGLVVGVAAAATLAVGSGVAAASFTSAHTGEHATDPRISDHSEWLNTAGDDFPDIARRLAAGVPFAPGDGPDTYLGVALPTTGEVSTAGVRSWLAEDAFCGWEGYWLQERAAGDPAAAARAVDALRTLAVHDVPAGAPVSDTSPLPVAAAAAAGDTAPVREDWTANCASLPRPWAHR